MKKVGKILASALCVATLVCGTLGAMTGCGSKKESITVSGSSSVTPIMEKLAAEYEKTHDIRIKINESDSSTGIKDVQNGLNDFGMSSRDLTEKDTGVKGYTLCMDGIALIVNKSCDITDVSKADVKALYENGTSIPNSSITAAIGREAGSGTRKAFDDLMKIEKYLSGTSDKVVSEITSTGGVKTTIATATNSIGYISYGSLDDTVKAVSLDGVACTVENIMNNTYALQRPFVIVLKENGTLSAAAQGFYDYIMSAEAQTVITGAGYISVK